ncbi:MAG: small ribosomal subunit biogenesis GTPase RsgA [Gammaproteobacteria bacterium]|nr:small ribosomal subunit biogenesis GTPase RsgA [Gammaproteobacteria bacterium]
MAKPSSRLAHKKQSQKTSSEESAQGRVIAHFGKLLVVEDAQGEQHRCVPRRNLPPLVCGDYVNWHYSDPKSCVITGLIPRSSLLSRPDTRGKQKSIAANIEQILIINAPIPAFNEGLLDRYLVAATHTKIHPIIVINKTDLFTNKEREEFQQRLNIYKQIGYSIIFTSAHEDEAFNVLNDHLQGKTSILVGQSGVGKSSLLNRLLPEVDAKVGDISEATGKGQHTTTTARLYHLPNSGSLIDSPGIREFGLWEIQPAQLASGFIEFTQQEQSCRFRDCMHKNEPGCAILDAVEKGEISTKRYQSYLRILESLTNETG